MKNGYINRCLCDLKNISVEIGSNLDYIQASGGNTSFKNGNRMWIKASGKQLSKANKENIFVCLENINESDQILSKSIDDTHLKKMEENDLRESIETLLHAVMPHKFVIHSHPIEIIRETLIENNLKTISKLMANRLWVYVEYQKPGKELAKAVYSKIKNKKINYVILSNHGLVVGGKSAAEVKLRHNKIVERFYKIRRETKLVKKELLKKIKDKLNLDSKQKWYIPEEEIFHSLATDDWSFNLAELNPLYPDHIVFCGKRPLIIKYEEIIQNKITNFKKDLHYLIIKNIGILFRNNISPATVDMVKAQACLNLSIPVGSDVRTLTDQQCREIVGLDSEKYRIELSQRK